MEAQAARRLSATILTRKSALEASIKSIASLIEKGVGKVTEFAGNRLVSLASLEAKWQTSILRDAMRAVVDFTMPSPSLLRAVVYSKPFQGELLSGWYDDLSKKAQKLVSRSIRAGVVEGKTVPEMVQSLRGTRAGNYKDGILNVTRRDAESIVRTSVNHTVTEARDETYGANADLLDGWRFVATLDGRTTLLCASLDGQTFPLGEGPKPPRHFNCRSTTAPLLKSYKEMGLKIKSLPEGVRESVDGSVPKKTTYGEWLKTKDASFQDEVLGPARGQLFREGKVGIADFIDESGKMYTLKQLAKRENLPD